jgi:outer membrane protein assembly factor BamD (BamD/ComL family)
MYLKLDSSFKLAKNSIVDLQPQRFKETQTAYYDLIDRFPETSYRKAAERIFQETVEELTTLRREYEELFN